jgi:hypothetical protein
MIEIKNAVIESATITTGERGFLDVWLNLDYGGSGQGFGGFCLYLPKSYDHHHILSPGGHFIFRVMEIAGVTDWDKLKGKSIRVLSDHTRVSAIGHIIKNDWFILEEDFKLLPRD